MMITLVLTFQNSSIVYFSIGPKISASSISDYFSSWEISIFFLFSFLSGSLYSWSLFYKFVKMETFQETSPATGNIFIFYYIYCASKCTVLLSWPFFFTEAQLSTFNKLHSCLVWLHQRLS